MPKTYLTATERAAEVVAWRQSGKSTAEWCREHGVSSGTLYRWIDEQEGKTSSRKQRVKHAPKDSQAITFQRLASGHGSQAPGRSSQSIVLDLMLAAGPARVRIDAGADATMVQALVESLMGVSR
jgi:transposase-like protein